MAVPTFTSKGVKATTPAKLDKEVFGVEVTSHQLLKDVYVSYMANGRDNLAVTKTRGLVRGGGRKPWKQKGTGKARFGSSRVPIWRGGGITFGPTGQENYVKRVNTKAKRQAIRQALSLANEAGKISVIDSFDAKNGKAKQTAALLEKIGAKRRILFAVENKTDEVKRASGNISNLKVVQANYISVYDILNADTVIITKPSLEIISTWLGGGKK